MPASDIQRLESIGDFLELLREVNILTDAQFSKAITQLPPDLETAKQAAQALVQQGVITAFQANRLMLGKRDGYSLGPYVLLDQVSHRPTGRVFRALHRTMNRIVALKVLAPEVTRNEETLQHFYQQARSAAQLIHPNVVTVLDVNQTGKRLYFVLEYVEGTGADELVKRSGPLPVPQALEFIRQAALGLQHAHDQGYVHGGLAPSCLLIGRPGGARTSTNTLERPSAKISNFGLRGPTDLLSSQQTDLDPVDYRAPESFHQPSPTAAGDVYSLGCVLVYLVTGKPPFPLPDLASKLQAHQQSPPPDLHQLRAEVPPHIARLVQHMLAKNPTQRPNAGTVASQLHPYADSDDPTARIDFNLPQNQVGASSVNTGFLSGLTTPNPTRPLPDSSPWELLEDATVDGSENRTPLTIRKPPRATNRRLWLLFVVLALAVTICFITFVGIALTVRHLLR